MSMAKEIRINLTTEGTFHYKLTCLHIDVIKIYGWMSLQINYYGDMRAQVNCCLVQVHSYKMKQKTALQLPDVILIQHQKDLHRGHQFKVTKVFWHL